MTVLLSNNSSSRLNAAISASATIITLKAGGGDLFPNPSLDEWFPITVAKQNGQYEIMRCTSRSGDELTVQRAQEGTSALVFSENDLVELRLTSGALSSHIGDKIENKVDKSDSRLTNAREWTASVISQSEAETGTATTARKWTAQRVRQAIAAWWATVTLKASDIQGLGTAATANLGTGSNDAARGNHAHDQYWDIVNPTGYAPDKDLNDFVAGEGGYVRTDLNPNAPITGLDVVTKQQYGSTDLLQIAFPQRTVEELYMRTAQSGTWRDWIRFWTTRNFDPATKLNVTEFNARSITAGNGMSGGGNLSANRTITLGTPSAISKTSTNSVTSTSHTHELDAAVKASLAKADSALQNGAYGMGLPLPLKVLDANLIADEAGVSTGLYPYLSNSGSTNVPHAYVYIFQIFYSTSQRNCTQIAYGYNISRSWIRYRYGGVWSPWQEQLVPESLLDSTGNSATYPMTQKATTEALNTKLDLTSFNARTITASNGLTGGGNLSANRTIALGTPSEVNEGSTNSVTSTSHTHALSANVKSALALARTAMQAGAFGLGGYSAKQITSEADFLESAATNTTEFIWNASAINVAGKTLPAYSAGFRVARNGSGHGVKILANENALMFGRDTLNSAWHDGNFNPDSKQNTLTAGTNVSISGNTISATDTKYTAGNGLTLIGTTFSLPVTVSGSGTYVQSVVQSANGITVTLGTPPNTTYSAASQAEAEAGTATTSRVWSAQRVRQSTAAYTYSKSEIDTKIQSAGVTIEQVHAASLYF